MTTRNRNRLAWAVTAVLLLAVIASGAIPGWLLAVALFAAALVFLVCEMRRSPVRPPEPSRLDRLDGVGQPGRHRGGHVRDLDGVRLRPLTPQEHARAKRLRDNDDGRRSA